jgi:hypothetical protein
MSALAGQDFLLQVETVPGSNTFITVMNFNSNSKKSAASETKNPVFHKAAPLISTAPIEDTYTVGGLEDLQDPGQALLRAAFYAQTTLRVRELWDGVLGEVQTVRVGGYTFEAKPDTLETITYDLTAVDVGVVSAVIDHVTVTPASFSLAYPTTQQLTATAYDAHGNPLPGVPVTWSSSDPSVGAVDANGVVRALSTGSATITATMQGFTSSATVSATGPTHLVPDVSWGAFNMDTRLRSIGTNFNPNTGYFQTIPRPGSSGFGPSGNAARHWYMRSPTEWRSSKSTGTWGTNNPGDIYNRSQIAPGVVVAGPTDDICAIRCNIDPQLGTCESGVSGGTAYVKQADMATSMQYTDDQEIANRIVSLTIVVKPAEAAMCGKKFWVETMPYDKMDQGGSWNPFIVQQHAYVMPRDMNTWLWITLEFPNANTYFNVETGVRVRMAEAGEGGTSTGSLVDVNIGPGRPLERANPQWQDNLLGSTGFHETLGLVSQFETRNSWYPSDENHTFTGGGSEVLSTVDVPDAGDYSDGHKAQLITLPSGAAITTPAPRHVEYFEEVLNTPAEYVRVGLWISPGPGGVMPNDGDLQATLVVASGGPTFGPVPLIRDHVALRAPNGASFYRTSVVAFQPNPGVEQGTNTTSWMEFTPSIVNVTGGALTFHASRCFMEGSAQRVAGRFAILPARAITVAGTNEATHLTYQHPENVWDVSEGIWILRHVLPYDAADPFTVFHDSPGLWQPGPYGTAGWSFNGDLQYIPGSHAKCWLSFSAERGTDEGWGSTPPPNPIFWGANVELDPGQIPAFTPWDIVLVWKGGILIGFALGIGQQSGPAGPGTGLTWFNDGDLFGANRVTVSSGGTDHWGTFDHIQLLGDRDRTRNSGGWLQAWLAVKNTPVDAGNFKAQIEFFIANDVNFGPRRQY